MSIKQCLVINRVCLRQAEAKDAPTWLQCTTLRTACLLTCRLLLCRALLCLQAEHGTDGHQPSSTGCTGGGTLCRWGPAGT